MNQVYFPHYKEIREADGNSYILISHPTTQRAYKIKIEDFDLAVAEGLISTDADNKLIIGSDGLLFAEATDTIYTANGTLTGNRTVQCGSNNLYLTSNDSGIVRLQTTSIGRVSQVFTDAGLAAVKSTDALGNETSITLQSGEVVVTPYSKLKIKDPAMASTAVGYVLTLQNTTTGECTWQKSKCATSGMATLVNGAVTIATTAVSPASVILITGGAINASTAVGILRVTSISAGASFNVKSYQGANPASIESRDQSTIYWTIV